MEGGIRLSIIMPFYNVEQYLPACLDSIAGQLTLDTELLCIDDGSTDGSSKICDDYSRQYASIVTFHQKNAGVSAARNAGLKLAKGEFITFLDSDDFVAENYIKEILSSMEDQELLVFESSRVKPDQTVEHSGFPLLEAGRNGAACVCGEIENCRFFQCWDKVYRREIIEAHDITFPVGCLFGEDMQFVLQYVAHIQDAFCIKKALYCYRLRDSSASQKTSLAYLRNHVENYYILRAFLESHACRDFSSMNRTTFHIVCQCVERLSDDELGSLKSEPLLSKKFIAGISDFPYKRSIEKLRVFLLKHRLFRGLHLLGKVKNLLAGAH